MAKVNPLALPKPFGRLDQFAIDPTSHWDDNNFPDGFMRHHLDEYVKNSPLAYEGQIITRVTRIGPESEQKVEVFVIDLGRKLRKIGEIGAGGTITSIDASKVTLGKVLEVRGVSYGSIPDNEDIPAETTLDVLLEAMFQKPIPPTYISPELIVKINNQTLSHGDIRMIEVGETVTPSFNMQFIQNDAGDIKVPICLRKDNDPTEIIRQATAEESIAGITVDDYSISFNSYHGGTYDLAVSVAYLQGAIKNDNLGNPCEQGRISDGIQEIEFVYKPYLNAYFGTEPLSRSLPKEKMVRDTENVKHTISIPKGATQVVIAIPLNSTFEYEIEVLYKELGADVSDTFEVSWEDLPTADPAVTHRYKVFKYTPAIPFTSAATYDVTVKRGAELPQ